MGDVFKQRNERLNIFFSNFLTSAAIDFQLSVRCVRNRPIQGYRRHFVKGAKPLGRARGQTNGDAFTMPKHTRCCVGFCDNEKRFPNLLVVRSHRWPKDPNLAELWRKQVAKGRSDNFNPEPGSEGTFVCSNHFPEGTRTRHNPSTDYPSVFLTLSDFLNKPSPKKRKVSERLDSEDITRQLHDCTPH